MFTDSPFTLVQAESDHRDHAIVEQVFADLIDGPWAHLPSSAFNANAAWVQLAAIAHTLTRALGRWPRPATPSPAARPIRAELVQVAARPARSGRDTITWHLPENWPWQDAWLSAFDATHRAPPAAAA